MATSQGRAAPRRRLIGGALATLTYTKHLLRRPEQQTIDARYQIRGTDRRRTAGFVLVNIDSTTFSDFENQHLHAHWPFPRRYDARVIEQLHRARAKVIAYDVRFTERTDTPDDNALIEAVGRAGNVVLSTTEVGEHGTTDVLGGDQVLRVRTARDGAERPHDPFVHRCPARAGAGRERRLGTWPPETRPIGVSKP
jgi:CHASE2 domain-containing sensor protein